LVWKSDSFRKVNGMDAFDLDGDGFMEIIAGCSDSNVRVFSASSYLMKQKADAYYQKALEYSGDRKYESCVQFISNASGLYEKLSDASGSSRAETLKEKCTNQLTASGYMNKSMLYFSQGDYINSTIYVDRALDLYRMMGDTKSVNEAVSLKDKIRVTPLSGEYLNYSKYYFEAGLYDNASFYAAKAREAYSYMGDSDGVAAAEEVSNNVSRAQAYALIQTALSKSESGDLNASIYLQEANVTFIRLNDTDGLAAVANASLVVSSRMADAERMSSIRGAIDGVINTLTENIMVVIAFVVVGIIVLLILVAVALSLYINKGDTPNKEGGSGGSYLDDFGKRKKGGGALSHLGSSLGKGQDGIPLF
ncbi:MAG: tetratricopeptide repeat protein, partial [Candidatus Altiarchaeota archaeon]|nr:tetratricopeptide repeat protein [Candidatus Altiarchaeota archaeon]